MLRKSICQILEFKFEGDIWSLDKSNQFFEAWFYKRNVKKFKYDFVLSGQIL